MKERVCKFIYIMFVDIVIWWMYDRVYIKYLK